MEAQALVQLGGSGMVPISIRHALLPLEWKVLTVLENWTTPTYWAVLGTPRETRRFRARVSGPLPGRPMQTGEFVMTIRRYAGRPGWWIAPGTDPAGKAKRLAGLIAICIAIAGLSLPAIALSAASPASTAWRLTATPARTAWGLAPASSTGTYPRPDAYCAARVQQYPERVAANATANTTIPPAGSDFHWGPWVNQTPEMAYNFSKVDGNFSGTTDEILEWAACKWGMDQNIAKAEAMAESSWYQSTVGDNGDSYGILQVRAAPDGSPASANNGWGGYPWTQKSTALDADAQMAYLRAVYDGQSYMGNGGNGSPALKGDIWNAVSTWESGSDTGPDSYTQEIQGYLTSQAWQRSYPLHSAMPAGAMP
jgi:hypothetical protein